MKDNEQMKNLFFRIDYLWYPDSSVNKKPVFQPDLLVQLLNWMKEQKIDFEKAREFNRGNPRKDISRPQDDCLRTDLLFEYIQKHRILEEKIPTIQEIAGNKLHKSHQLPKEMRQPKYQIFNFTREVFERKNPSITTNEK